MIQLDDKQGLAGLAEAVKDHLLTQVMAFWEAHTVDPAGGYHTCLDRRGNLMKNEKNIWMHARQVWMFSKVYLDVEPHAKWLALARHGREYLIQSKAYAGKGRWNYALSPQSGEAITGSVSLYTDAFALMGLCAYAEASGETADEALIEETFAQLEQNVQDPDFRDVFPQQYAPDTAIHGVYMISLYACAQAAPILGRERTSRLKAYCVEQMLNVMLDRQVGCLLEIKHRDGRRVDGGPGRVINPGHNFEGLWFIMQEADGMGRQDDGVWAARMALDMWQRAKDPQAGGLLYMLDVGGGGPGLCDWNRKRSLQWDEKVWWTHAEGLAALLSAALRLQSQAGFAAFQELYAYCLDHFWDREYGEWYAVLHRDGTPRLNQKGGMQKAAFHVPRSLYVCYLLLKEVSQC